MIWMYSAGFVRDNERVKPRAQTWSRQVNKPADICISCLTTLPFITSSHLSRRPSQLLLLPFVGAITWHYHSKHHFFLFEFQTGSSWQTWGRSWAMSVACQCSSFDRPRLVRCLIALLWQVNLSLRCSALEKCETLPGRPEWYASKNKVATQLNGRKWLVYPSRGLLHWLGKPRTQSKGFAVRSHGNQTTTPLLQLNFVFTCYICIQMLTEMSKFLKFASGFAG